MGVLSEARLFGVASSRQPSAQMLPGFLAGSREVWEER